MCDIIVGVPELLFLAINTGVNPQVDLNGYALLKTIKVEDAYTTNDGLFLVIDKSFTSEIGYFVPRRTEINWTNEGGAPEFRLLADSVYKYRISG